MSEEKSQRGPIGTIRINTPLGGGKQAVVREHPDGRVRCLVTGVTAIQPWTIGGKTEKTEIVFLSGQSLTSLADAGGGRRAIGQVRASAPLTGGHQAVVREHDDGSVRILVDGLRSITYAWVHSGKKVDVELVLSPASTASKG